jgi:signal transduction histidine kinase/HAMP domain-containing protein
MFLELLVFSRLTRLSKEVNVIQAGESFTDRVTISRRDELGRLSQDINAMLDALTQAQTRREEAQGELRSRVNDLLALNDTAVLLLSRLDATNILENVCRLAVEKFGVELAWIGTPVYDRKVIRPVAAYGCDVKQLPLLSFQDDDGRTCPAYAALDSAQVVVHDQPVDFAGTRWGIQAVFPLSIEPDQLSVLILYHRDAGHFLHNRIQILEAFSNLASISLQNVLLFRQVRNGRKRQETLARRLVELQEEERKRIAMELHDEVGQILTGLNLMLGADLSVFPAAQRERLENARKLVNDLIGRVRQMSLTLRPSMLDDLGLLPTLLWHFENYTRQTAIQVRFHHDEIEGERFSPKIETAAYRVVQEALTNVARHAGVDEVTVQIWAIDGILHVQVEDEGRGFDSEGYPQTGGTFGLLGMQERAISLRGNLTIDSQPGRGTSLLIQFPLEGILERRTYDRNHSAGR